MITHRPEEIGRIEFQQAVDMGLEELHAAIVLGRHRTSAFTSVIAEETRNAFLPDAAGANDWIIGRPASSNIPEHFEFGITNTGLRIEYAISFRAGSKITSSIPKTVLILLFGQAFKRITEIGGLRRGPGSQFPCFERRMLWTPWRYRPPLPCKTPLSSGLSGTTGPW